MAGGYTRAARQFPYPITQPGVHQQVRRLEDELGVRLFVRFGRDQVQPTAAGAALLAFCAPFFEGLPHVVAGLGEAEPSGCVRIDAAALEIRTVLPAWLRAVRASMPALRIDLEEVATGDVTRLASGKVDLVVDHFERVPRGFAGVRVGTHQAFLVAPTDHPASRRARLRIEDFRREPLIAFSPSSPHGARQLAAISAVFPPERVLTASSTEAILGFVAAGLGYSLIPWPTTSGPVMEGVRVTRVRGAGTAFPIWAVHRAGAERDPRLAAVLSAAPKGASRARTPPGALPSGRRERTTDATRGSTARRG